MRGPAGASAVRYFPTVPTSPDPSRRPASPESPDSRAGTGPGGAGPSRPPSGGARRGGASGQRWRPTAPPVLKRFVDAWRMLPRRARRILTAAGGGSVLLVGVLMLVLPGPAIVVIPLGLSILAAEFAWARRFIKRLVPETWQPSFLVERDPDGPATERDPGESREASEGRTGAGGA